MKLDPSAFVADPELIQAFENRSALISSGEDRILFRQGEIPRGLYILCKGEATLTMNSPAGEQVMSIQAGAGSLLGLPGLIGEEPYTLTAIANSNAELRFVTREEFESLMRTCPLLSLKVLQVMAAEVRSARKAILQL